MKSALVGTAVGAGIACALGASVPASADVRAGVDAWQQGDYSRAVAEWRSLANAGDVDAQFNMGQAYKLGRGVPVDLPAATEWFRKAAAQGHTRASDNYGFLLFQQGQRADAMPYIRKSAERGEPRAQYILGTAMFNGDLAAKDWVTAYALMTRAAAAGLDQASKSLVVMDKWIPAEQREKGMALATALAKADKSERPAAGAAPARAGKSSSAKATPPKSTSAKPSDGSKAVATATTLPPPKPDLLSETAPQTATPTKPVASGSKAIAGKPPPKPAPPGSTVVASASATAPPKTSSKGGAVKLASNATAPPSPHAAGPPAPGDWRIQLGAYRDVAPAKAFWAKISGRIAELGAFQPYFPRAGDVVRLQVGPLRSQADAAKLCGRLHASGYDCLVKRE
jgi:cell division septation protein DedD